MSRDWTREELQAASEAMQAAGHVGYEEFAARLIIEEFAKIQTDGQHLCPRCGRMTAKERIITNALSRHADVYICDECGTDEAMRDFGHCVLPLSEWAIAALPRVERE